MSQLMRGEGGHLVFQINCKNTNLVKDIEILFPVKFGFNSVQQFNRSHNISANQEVRKIQTW